MSARLGERIAVETLSGTITTGTVVEREPITPNPDQLRYRYTVEVDGQRYRVDRVE